MKYIRIFVFALFFAPMTVLGASNEFVVAAQLLAAAKNGDIAQVQSLVNSGANVNFVDSTGVSIVCTALMNNDVKAAQILQMYGADASQCDRQIKQYNKRNKQERSGGLFGGLSSVQTIALTAAGAAVVVGGLLLLTDVFDPGNKNSHSGGDGNRPGQGDGSGSGNGPAVATITLPYGPAMPNAESESANYTNNLNLYSNIGDKDNPTQYYKNFQAMNLLGANSDGVGGQNYLLLMHGYSPLARGYMGMETLRNLQREPISLSGNNLGTEPVLGGRPVNVALVTTNGVNAAAGTSLEDARLLPWTTLNNNATTTNGASNSMVSSKYYNNKIVYGADTEALTDDTVAEDATLVATFDLSGHGTAIHNTMASAQDNLLGKIVGGVETGYSNTGDFSGFMPNGQMTIFRTGGDMVMREKTDSAMNGTYTQNDSGVIQTLTLPGVAIGGTADVTLNVTMGTDSTFTATSGSGDDALTYNGYIGTNGMLYIANTAGAGQAVNLGYELGDGGVLTLSSELGLADGYYNYVALNSAINQLGALPGNSNPYGRSNIGIIANAAVITPLHSSDSKTTISYMLKPTSGDMRSQFAGLIDSYYDINKTDNLMPSVDALAFYDSVNKMSPVLRPLVVFSTGAVENTGGYYAGTLEATFENAAPLVFPGLEHLFMSIVGVGVTGNGTGKTSNVSGYSPSGKIALTQWQSGDDYYKARVCGMAGRGAGGIDPWCFAAAGITDEMAVASAAGAAGAVKSAFSYLSNQQLFTLLALTADGPYLGATTDGVALTKDNLRAYLQEMYQLPDEYQFRFESGEEYLDLFKEVFGYGLINLERATKPGMSIYYYDANKEKIVSASGNAYWGKTKDTSIRTSSAFNPRAASISAPFFDVLESADGDLRLPRVWENEVALGAGHARGLYMGDVLGELHTRASADNTVKVGDIDFSMKLSERAYNDNMNGLDNMRLAFTRGNWKFVAEYQHSLTDGVSKFTGNPNPVLSLASNAISSDVAYGMGNWTIGARAFSGSVTDAELLENDPTVTSQFTPARLGLMRGGEMSLGWGGAATSLTASVGFANESDTVLGAATSGLLSLGAGSTTYADVLARYNVAPRVMVSGRATFARTTADATGEFILGLSTIESNAFSLGLDIGGLSLSVAQPLAAQRGRLAYSYAEYDVAEDANGNYDLVIRDAGRRTLDLRAENREVRFAGTYRQALGEFTDAAFGFIYRVHPNNMDEFGNESIFMIKLSHRVGI